MNGHTAGPWRVSKSVMKRNDFINPMVECPDQHEPLIAELYGQDRPYEEKEANAAFIVRACNSHEELLAALKELASWDIDAEMWSLLYDRTNKARAAIQKAEGK